MSTWRQVLYVQVQVQVQVLASQVQVRIQVVQNCTRVQLEYNYQVLHLCLYGLLRQMYRLLCHTTTNIGQ